MEWKEHPTIVGYLANEKGEIARVDETSLFPLDTLKIVKQTLNSTGYLMFTCHKKSKIAHRFIYECFYGLIEKGMVIDHINCDRTDNRIENLRKTTTKENNSNPITVKRQLEMKREKNGKKVLKLDKKTGEILGYYESVRQAAEENGTLPQYIRWVCNGKKGYYSAAGYKWEWAKYRYSCKWGKWWISGDL